MLNRFLQWFKAKKLLLDENKSLKARVEKLESHICTPESAVTQVLKRGISWYNYEELDLGKQAEYWSRAQDILRNPVFENEVHHFEADLVQHIAKQAKDYGEVRDLRMTINGVETFQQRLQHIKNPTRVESVDEDSLHEPI